MGNYKGRQKYYEPGKFVTLLGYENSETWMQMSISGDETPWHIDSFPKRLFDFARRICTGYSSYDFLSPKAKRV